MQTILSNLKITVQIYYPYIILKHFAFLYFEGLYKHFFVYVSTLHFMIKKNGDIYSIYTEKVHPSSFWSKWLFSQLHL